MRERSGKKPVYLSRLLLVAAVVVVLVAAVAAILVPDGPLMDVIYPDGTSAFVQDQRLWLRGGIITAGLIAAGILAFIALRKTHAQSN